MNLSLQHVCKTYSNGVAAIDDVSVEFKPGMFGLLGPNGAGKSTLMRTMATLQAPDSGQILFNGLNIFRNKIQYRQSLGYLPQDFGLYPKEKAGKLLHYFAVLKGLSSRTIRERRVQKVLEITNLLEYKNEQVGTFSGGMKQRFGIAQLLLNQPKVIIVDEPTAGLDPAERRRFLNVLRHIVVFSTHLVDDVMELCRDMAVMGLGKILSQASPQKAITSLKGFIWEAEIPDGDMAELPASTIHLSERYDGQNRLIRRLYATHRHDKRFTAAEPTLKDYYFLTLTKN